MASGVTARDRAAPTAAPGAGFREEAHGERGKPIGQRIRLVAATVIAPLAAWGALVSTVCLIAEIASAPTWHDGVDSSTWTPLRGVAALVAGADAFGGDFDAQTIAGALVGLAAYAVALGVPGSALIVWVQGTQPGFAGAAVQGIAYGLSMQVLVVNLLVNWIQAEPTVYRSLPPWGWWAAHAAFGAMLGLATAAVLHGGRR